MDDRLVITVAPCIPPQMRPGIRGLDLSPEGVADEVVRAYNAGAAAVHLHVWDEHGLPSTELLAFERTIRLIRERCDIVVEGSTGGPSHLSAAERSVALAADLEMASLNPGSVNFERDVYANAPEDIVTWARQMHQRAIKPDCVIFEAGMISNSLALAQAGLIDAPLLFSFVLGQQGALPATPRNLLFLVETIPAGAVWGAIGHGGHDLVLGALAVAMGGHVRVGFEDNPVYRAGELAESNAQLVERMVRLGREIGRPIATPAEAREMLGLERRPGGP
jgi:3-keto-5-aminohexanoate cleavage enzyme